MNPSRWIAALAIALGAIACGGDGAGGSGGGGGGTGGATGGAPPICAAVGLEEAPKHRAEQLTSLFENGTVEIDYAYAEALDDGRGITAGRAGFTTATGDLVFVVQIYVAEVPDSALAAYLPRLRELADEEDGSIEGLDGLVEAWAAAADDPRFRDAQDAVVDSLYYEPVLVHASAIGVCQPLSVAVLYDAIIQHGEGDDPDGLDALVTRTTAEVGASPAEGADERGWVLAFLDVRRADLEHAFDPETREVWAESAGRCDVWRQIADDGNWALEGPIEVDLGDYQGTVQ